MTIPKLIKARSLVFTCAGCKKWVGRCPMFLDDELDGEYQCDACGSTSVEVREGRPYSVKSRQWQWVAQQFDSRFEHFHPSQYDEVVTVPPMSEARGKTR